MGAFLATLSMTSAGGVTAHHKSGPDLKITISGPSHIRTGTTRTYELHLKNVGGQTATGIAFSASVGDQFNGYPLKCPKGWHLDGSECAGSLRAHASLTFLFKVHVCCLFQGEERHASIMAMYFSSDFVDPTPADDWVAKPVYITGPWQN
jgi:hypothetical protein